MSNLCTYVLFDLMFISHHRCTYVQSDLYYIQDLVLLLSCSCYGDNAVLKNTCRVYHYTLKTIGCHTSSHKCPCILTTNVYLFWLYLYCQICIQNITHINFPATYYTKCTTVMSVIVVVRKYCISRNIVQCYIWHAVLLIKYCWRGFKLAITLITVTAKLPVSVWS